MFGQEPYYFGLTKKYISLFGAIFSDIQIVRSTSTGAQAQILNVPISYSPKDKMMARIKADPAIDREFAIQMPVMGFEIVNFQYDSSRKINTLGKTVKKTLTPDKRLMSYQFNPVPYNLHINLYIFVKNNEDGMMIIEQILPSFPPNWTPTVELVPQLDIKYDVPIIYQGLVPEDNYAGDFKTRQSLVYTLSFLIKAQYFGPIIDQPVIKFANTTFYIPNSAIIEIRDAVGNTDPSDRVTVQPGLTANGEPTSNIALTIPYQQIEANTHFGYIVTTSGIIIIE